MAEPRDWSLWKTPRAISTHLPRALTPGTVKTSNQMECGSFGFVDPPVVDSSTEYVYLFIGDGCSDGTAPVYSSYINVFAAGTSINASYGHNNAQFNNQTTNDIGTVQYHGMFDNAYYAGSGNTGNLYACVNGAVYQFGMAQLSTGTEVTHTTSPGYSVYHTPASSGERRRNMLCAYRVLQQRQQRLHGQRRRDQRGHGLPVPEP